MKTTVNKGKAAQKAKDRKEETKPEIKFVTSRSLSNAISKTLDLGKIARGVVTDSSVDDDGDIILFTLALSCVDGLGGASVMCVSCLDFEDYVEYIEPYLLPSEGLFEFDAEKAECLLAIVDGMTEGAPATKGFSYTSTRKGHSVMAMNRMYSLVPRGLFEDCRARLNAWLQEAAKKA